MAQLHLRQCRASINDQCLSGGRGRGGSGIAFSIMSHFETKMRRTSGGHAGAINNIIAA